MFKFCKREGEYMRAVSGLAENSPTLVAGNFSQGGAKNCTFGIVAKAIWRKPASELAYRCKVSERTAKYWLSGAYDPSCAALLAIMDEIVRK